MDKAKNLELLNQNKEQFDKYFNLLVEWNEKINLTAITQYDEVMTKHFEDSIAGNNLVPQNATLCDVGTGAGFPGIPLKIVRDDIKLTLMDSLNKRVNFLQTVSDNLGLGAKCIHSRAEDAGKGIYREKFDVVTARAVARLNTLCEYCLPLVKVGGKFLAYKALVQEELEEGQKAIKILGGKVEQICKFDLSNGDSRSIVVITKVAPTPNKYPRGKGKERSAPIV